MSCIEGKGVMKDIWCISYFNVAIVSLLKNLCFRDSISMTSLQQQQQH